MNTAVIMTFWLIVLARITDVSLDTIRTVSIVQGRRVFAAVLGFFQAVIVICAVAKVLTNMEQPVYALAYGLGFALGTYLGIVIEQRLAFGNQLVFLLTPKGPQLAAALRAGGYRVAEFGARTNEGELTILSVEIPRRKTQTLLRLARAFDEQCIALVNDIRLPSFARRGGTRRNLKATPKDVSKSLLPHRAERNGAKAQHPSHTGHRA